MTTKQRYVEGVIRTTGELGLREAKFTLAAVPTQPLSQGMERWACRITFMRELRGHARTQSFTVSFSARDGASRPEWDELAKTEVRNLGVAWEPLGQGIFEAEFPQWTNLS